MAQRKKTSKRRRSNAKQHRLANNLAGIAVILLILVGLFNLGALGAVIQGFFKLLVGAGYPVLMLVGLLYGLGFALYARWLHFSPRRIAGFVVCYLGLLIWLHVLMMNQLNVHAKIPAVTWSNLSKAVLNGDSTLQIGGGMMGAYLYAACDVLVDRVGTAIFAWLLMVSGVVIFFALPWRDFLRLCGRLVQRLLGALHTGGQELSAKMKQPGVTAPATTSAGPSLGKKVQDFFKDDEEEATPPSAAPAPSPQAPTPVTEPKITVASDHQESAAPNSAVAGEQAELSLAGVTAQADKDYQLPPLTLLSKVKATDQQADLKNIKKNKIGRRSVGKD